ncbi:MAG: glycosyltransferase, partial [Enterococcus gilvus]
HGGEGTVQTACASGKPFVGIGLQYEQEVNVAYCEAFGNAIALPPNRLTPQTLDHCIRRLSTGEVQEKAREMQQLMAHAKGAQNAAEQIKQTYL